MQNHLYDEDGAISMDTRMWFLDVIDGLIALLPEQREDFHFLLEERADGRF